MTAPARQRVWDPLYGRMELDSEEFDLLLAPEIQRLRYVRMCNINSMLVTGASEISRFEHSLGVLRLAREWLNHHSATPAEARAFRAAALIHDMQTGPFGHSFQYILEDNDFGEEFEHENLKHGSRIAFHQDLEANVAFSGRPFRSRRILGSLWNEVAELISGRGRLGPLIAGTMDLDNIDNVVRLAFHSGVAGSTDAGVAIGLARDIEPASGGLRVSRTGLQLIERWQAIRRDLYKLLLHDWAEFSAKAMLTHAMELAAEAGLIGTDSWRWTDDDLMRGLERRSRGERQEIGELVKRLRCGDLYQPVALVASASVNAYERIAAIDVKRGLERDLAAFAKSRLGTRTRFIAHLILDRAKTERRVFVLLKENGRQLSVGRDSCELLVGVFAARPLPPRQADMLAERAASLLENLGLRQLRPIDDPMASSVPAGPQQLALL